MIYAIQCTAGSVLGAYVIYGLARGGARYVWSWTSPAAKRRAQQWLRRNDFISVLVASLLPPPAPFKIFLITAGMLHVNPTRFGAALLLGRGLRFMTAAFLGARYGPQAEVYLRRNFPWVSFLVAALVVAFTLFYRSRVSRPVAAPPPDEPDAFSSDQSAPDSSAAQPRS